MSSLRLILTSLLYHWRTNLAVACGVAVGSAVLGGALLVGDSMRGSLQHLALDRLGRIDEALVANRFFRAKLADELEAECTPHAPRAEAGDRDSEIDRTETAHGVCRVQSAAPAILLTASLENTDSQSAARANRVSLIGCDERFWRLGAGGPKQPPQPREIVLNQPLAEQLDVVAGDAVLLRLPRLGAIPADSPLGKKRETVVTQRLTVSEVIPAEGLGRFGLRPTQQLVSNAYVPLEWLADRLDQPGGANAIFVAEREGDSPIFAAAEPIRTATSPIPRKSGQSPVNGCLRPTLADYGLSVEASPQGYINITSDRMILSSDVVRAIVRALDGKSMVQPACTYLANTIADNGREIPYSTMTAIDFSDRPPLGPFLSPESPRKGNLHNFQQGGTSLSEAKGVGDSQATPFASLRDVPPDDRPLPPLGPDEIALNSWAADELKAKVGDTVRVSYFEPESIEGRVREKTVALRLAAIVKLAGAADDRDLTPRVKGMTDEMSMAEWDPPFPFDAKRIRPADEQYWDRYGPTPKAFVSLAAGRRLWGSRFGETTSIRVSTRGDSIDGVRQRLEENLNPAAMGLVFQPVRQQVLAASAGTTPFGVLFLAFSFFLIASAVMLVALLFRLGIERRAGQIGTLLALGWTRRKVSRLLLGEGLAVAAFGSLLGTPAGVGYAALMLLGLRTWWLAAVSTPFLRLYVTPASLAIGCTSGVLVALPAIWLSVRRVSRFPIRRLLAGQASPEIARVAAGRNWVQWLLVVAALAPTAALLLVRVPDDVQAGAFFGAGAAALAALLALVWLRLRAGATGAAVKVGGGNLRRMALRNAARNPGRSALSIGLVAAACFLIVAVSAFQIDSAQQSPALASGNGGFALVAESDQPIFHDVTSLEGRQALGFSPEDEKLLAGSTIFALRAKPGDDASCLNLYRPQQPRVLGLPHKFIDRGGFAWAAKPAGCDNPWHLLERNADRTPDTPFYAFRPAVLEKNTANYALNMWGGLDEALNIAGFRYYQVVALLADSIFQGDVLLSEEEFLYCFPETSGYRFFLIETPAGREEIVRRILERNLGDYGFAAETTEKRLARFLTVQNTYLATFQSLGGLGLLLGTLGLAAVQLRNVLERRGELALLRAAGFRHRMLVWLVLMENAALLLAGLGVGTLAALLAVLPQMTGRGATIPWASLGMTLAAVLLVGLAAGLLAVRAAVAAPLLATLREETT